MPAFVNPNNPNAADDSDEIKEAGRSVGIRVEIINASSDREIDEAFASIGQRHVDALMVHEAAVLRFGRTVR